MGAARSVLEIALVNNMPDQALAATDRQFHRLVQVGAGDRDIRWRRYFLPSIARSETARRHLARGYEPIEALYGRGADAMIVTGAEPRAARFSEEPYWDDVARLVDWARDNTASTIWSCLAAHAAVYRLDGIQRRRLPEKLSGVFELETTDRHWAETAGGRTLHVPHSRYNDIAREDLERRGYNVSTFGHPVGVGSFWRREPSLFLFLQGHAEYDPDTLLKEFRRDALRFVSGERADYPSPPQGYFSAETLVRLDALRGMSGGMTPEAFSVALGKILSEERCVARWAADAARLFRDWIAQTAPPEAWRDSA